MIRPALAALLLALAAPVTAQDPVRALLDRLRVDPAQLTEADCTAKVEEATTLNAMDLFHGASVCGVVHRDVEASFLLAAGQIRAMADMAVMQATDADRIAPSALYYLIFFYLGGAGSEEVLRNPFQTAQLLALLDGWSPAFGPNYDPGWVVTSRPEAAAYQTALAQSKTHRRNQLVGISRAWSDPEYYALHREFVALQQRVRVFEAGTPEAARATDLQRLMEARARALGADMSGR